MKYMGSKSKIKKDILPILQKTIDDNNIPTYIEPFVGGANIIDSIKCQNKIGGDKSETLIELLKYVRDGGELPSEVSKELYDEVRRNKNNDKYDKWFIGAIGYLASYNGRYFDGGYAKTIITKTGATRNYYDEAKRNLENQSKYLQGIDFVCGEYTQFSNISNSLIYCDPPYKDTKQYNTSKNFNHDMFWEWCRTMSKNNIVIISEEKAPKDFICIWEQNVKRTIDNNKRINKTERMFVRE